MASINGNSSQPPSINGNSSQPSFINGIGSDPPPPFSREEFYCIKSRERRHGFQEMTNMMRFIRVIDCLSRSIILDPPSFRAYLEEVTDAAVLQAYNTRQTDVNSNPDEFYLDILGEAKTIEGEPRQEYIFWVNYYIERDPVVIRLGRSSELEAQFRSAKEDLDEKRRIEEEAHRAGEEEHRGRAWAWYEDTYLIPAMMSEEASGAPRQS
ncbi:MAG: hypothetical protein Q9212_003954 [Teloschistes hypoglaucus]